jgi:hypothetical protein
MSFVVDACRAGVHLSGICCRGFVFGEKEMLHTGSEWFEWNTVEFVEKEEKERKRLKVGGNTRI